MYEKGARKQSFSYLLFLLTFPEVQPLGCPLPIHTQRSLLDFQATHANPAWVSRSLTLPVCFFFFFFFW